MSFHSAVQKQERTNTEPLISNGLLQCKSARDEHSFDGGKSTDLNSSEQVFNSASTGIFAASRFGHNFSLVLAHTDIVQQTAPLLHTGIMIQRFPDNEDASSEPAPETAPTPTTAEPEEESAAPEETVALTLLVEDSATELAPRQMRKSEFLAQLRTEITRTAEAAMAGTGRTTADCPYLDYWFDYYSAQDVQHCERALRRYAPEASSATTAREYIPIIAERVRRSVETWVRTGEVTGVPEGLPGMGLLGSIGSLVSGTGSIFFKARNGGARRPNDPRAIQAQLGSGQPLDSGVRSRMESAFTMDFSHVRTHTDSMAAGLSDSLNARAFTVGEHVAFGVGEYRPGTFIGDALIAHEMAHVVQQGGSTSLDTMQQESIGYNALEEDADLSAVGAVASLWGGAKEKLKDIAQNAMPRLRSGLRLSRCPDDEREHGEAPKEKATKTAPKEKVTLPPAPTGGDWVSNKTASGKKIGAGDMEGTVYIDASTSARAQKEPPGGHPGIKKPNFVGAYFTFSDKNKGNDCVGGGGDRVWLSYKYYKKATVVGIKAPPTALDQWIVDIWGNFVTNKIDFHDFPGLGVPGVEGIGGYMRRTYLVGIVCRCKSDPTNVQKGFLTKYSYNLDIWFNNNDAAVRVTSGESYGGPVDLCKIPPTGVTCVDNCPTGTSKPAPKSPEKK